MCTNFDLTYMYKRIVTVKVKEQDMDESRSSTSFGDSQTSQTRLASKWMWTSLRLLGLMKPPYICAAFTTRVGQNAKYILVCSYHAFLWK